MAVASIHVGLNWSLLVIAALIAWSLAVGLLPLAAPGQTSGAYWTAGIVSAFVYLACLLAHELAHSLVKPARRSSEPGFGRLPLRRHRQRGTLWLHLFVAGGL